MRDTRALLCGRHHYAYQYLYYHVYARVPHTCEEKPGPEEHTPRTRVHIIVHTHAHSESYGQAQREPLYRKRAYPFEPLDVAHADVTGNYSA